MSSILVDNSTTVEPLVEVTSARSSVNLRSIEQAEESDDSYTSVVEELSMV